MSTTPLFYINIFCKDMNKLAEFYQQLFNLTEIEESRTEYFRGFNVGGNMHLGFSHPYAYELLSLTPAAETNQGSTHLLTFNVENKEMLKQETERAVKLGATLVMEPFETYYGWYQSVLADPEGNPFRINYC